MTATPAIEAVGLTRRFGRTRAVDGLELTVPQGIVYGVLGPNGAGKTTTIRMLTTLLRPDAGTARVFGYDILREPRAVRRHVSLTGQFASVDHELTGRENLILMGRLLGLSRREAKARATGLLEAFDLSAAGGRSGQQALGGYAPATRHRRELDRQAEAAVPRRADHGPRSAEPPAHLGHRARDRCARYDRRADDPVSRRGRPVV